MGFNVLTGTWEGVFAFRGYCTISIWEGYVSVAVSKVIDVMSNQ